MSNLALELNIAPGVMVGLVGAGGKTTTVQRLVAELRGLGRRVLTTSTVHMMPLRAAAPHPLVFEPLGEQLFAMLPDLLAANGHVRVAGEQPRADKMQGLDVATVDRLKDLPGLDNLLVECDGARHRSFKAPAAHEPMIPPRLDLLLIVVGLDAIGQPLSGDFVHRTEQVSVLSGLREGDIITAEAMAAVLTDPQGGLKGKPTAARAWIIATKLSTETASAGEELARAILARAGGAIEGVVLLGPAPGGRLDEAALIVRKATSYE